MDENKLPRDSRIDVANISSTDRDTELEKKLKKLEKVLQETNRRSDKQQTIYEEVEKQSKTGFADLPLSKPTPADMQNPSYAHNLYYKQLRPLMRAFLPKGKEGKELRDQINLYLKEGYWTGRDGRQAYTKAMTSAVNIFKVWVNEFGGKQLVELYYRFRDLNKNFKAE